MNYPFLTVVVIAVMLTACKGEGKPGQYPPSLYQEREGVLTDTELEKNKKQAAEEIYPADDPAAPHAKSDKELTAEKVEKTDSVEAPKAPHAKSGEELKTDDDDDDEEAHPAEDKAEPRRGGY